MTKEQIMQTLKKDGNVYTVEFVNQMMLYADQIRFDYRNAVISLYNKDRTGGYRVVVATHIPIESVYRIGVYKC